LTKISNYTNFPATLFGIPSYNSGAALSFYFDQDNTRWAWNGKHVVTWWSETYIATQTRILVGPTHNYNLDPTAYVDENFQEAGWGAAASCVNTPMGAGNPEEFGVKFERISNMTWMFTVYELTGRTNIHNTYHNTNANTDSKGRFNVYEYLKASDVTYLDAAGEGYLHVAGVGNPGTENPDTASVLNMRHENTGTDEYAISYLNSMTCDSSGQSEPTKGADYNTVVAAFDSLPTFRQDELKYAAKNPTSAYGDDKVKEFGYRYATLVRNHGSSYDFMNVGNEIQFSQNSTLFTNDPVITTVTITSITVAALITFVFFRKKKRA